LDLNLLSHDGENESAFVRNEYPNVVRVELRGVGGTIVDHGKLGILFELPVEWK
jgi:hypothetical protein